ncbi:hypothetical protein CUP1481 [Campylobacter upsaliensis RM3195]|nr:hypothetical protein CUP1481 [Campylobacter upsaliensis RM3195]
MYFDKGKKIYKKFLKFNKIKLILNFVCKFKVRFDEIILRVSFGKFIRFDTWHYRGFDGIFAYF